MVIVTRCMCLGKTWELNLKGVDGVVIGRIKKRSENLASVSCGFLDCEVRCWDDSFEH